MRTVLELDIHAFHRHEKRLPRCPWLLAECSYFLGKTPGANVVDRRESGREFRCKENHQSAGYFGEFHFPIHG